MARCDNKSKMLLIDGNSIIHRAFYALPPLTNAKGMTTNAVYGFTTMLLKLIDQEQPSHIFVAFDSHKKTFRHEDFAAYKGKRSPTPSELSEQFPLVKELLQAFSIAWFELPGYEADDIIGTMAHKSHGRVHQTIIITGDRDLLQLCTEQTHIWITRKGISEVDRYTPAIIHEKYGIAPEQIIDLKGLAGDASDNIPGVSGIGEKTALKLLYEYGTVENLLAHTSDLKGKTQERLLHFEQEALMSKRLATIISSVPMNLDVADTIFNGFEETKVAAMFAKLGFRALREKMNFGEETVEKDEREKINYDILFVQNEQDWQQLNLAIADANLFYLESLGENPYSSERIGLAIPVGQICYIVAFSALNAAEAGAVRTWLEDHSKKKIGYNLHRAQLELYRVGIQLRGQAFDIGLASYLLNPIESLPSLLQLLRRYRLPLIASDQEIFGKSPKLLQEPRIFSHIASKAYAVSRLHEPVATQIVEMGMQNLYYELELPLSNVLAHMEEHGISVHSETLRNLGSQFTQRLEQMIGEIHRMVGFQFNIGSPKQLGDVLFERLGLPVIKETKTGYSTDVDVLEKLQKQTGHPIVDLLIRYRQLFKLQSTYIEGLLKEVDLKTGKIHTYFQQTITATGRLSSQFPNLQNIPIRMEEGRQIRKAFVPSEQGWFILSADYSQIELRVLAHISGDKRLQEAFLQKMDVHTKTAMAVFGVTADQVNSSMRRQAKAVNFGIVYGMSDWGLSQNLNIKRTEAKEFINQYYATFPGVRQYMTDIVSQARTDGYVATLLGRRRYLPEINHSNYNLRSFAERTAMNTPIQGSAADIIKLAMMRMHDQISERNLQSCMLLQVHDELVFEVPPTELELMKSLVTETMNNAFRLDVPLVVDLNAGPNWYEAK